MFQRNHRVATFLRASGMLGFLFLPSKKRIMEIENRQDLCQDILELILRKIPLKPRSRLKCVSKAWKTLITYLRHTYPPTTTSGLAFSFRKPSTNRTFYQLNLLDAKDQSESCSVHTSLTHNLPWLIDSCNGLLLFGVKDGSYLTYHVSSPMKNQWLKLPLGHDFSRPASASLAFDGVQQQFKLICQFWEEADIKNENIRYQVFSSKTREWKEYSAKIPNSSALLLSKDFNSEEWNCPSLYRKGKLYWIWSLYLLVFSVEKECFELMELPKMTVPVMSMYCGKRLWESEDRLHYCESTYLGFNILEYVDNSVHEDNNSNDYRSMWRLKRCIRMDELVTRNYELFQIPDDTMFSISPVTVKPCAFNKDLEILYFQMPGIIAAYSFETRKVVKVLSDSAICKNIHDNIYPFMFKAVDLHRFGSLRLDHEFTNLADYVENQQEFLIC